MSILLIYYYSKFNLIFLKKCLKKNKTFKTVNRVWSASASQFACASGDFGASIGHSTIMVDRTTGSLFGNVSFSICNKKNVC